jgi:hypothetical protein
LEKANGQGAKDVNDPGTEVDAIASAVIAAAVGNAQHSLSRRVAAAAVSRSSTAPFADLPMSLARLLEIVAPPDRGPAISLASGY